MLWNIQEMRFNRSGLNDGSEVCGSQQCTTSLGTCHKDSGLSTFHSLAVHLIHWTLCLVNLLYFSNSISQKGASGKCQIFKVIIPKEQKQQCFNKWQDQWNQCINLGRDCFKWDTFEWCVWILWGEKFQHFMVHPQTLWWSENIYISSLRIVLLVFSVFCKHGEFCSTMITDLIWSTSVPDIKFFCFSFFLSESMAVRGVRILKFYIQEYVVWLITLKWSWHRMWLCGLD
jgi:hypothetical protein